MSGFLPVLSLASLGAVKPRGTRGTMHGVFEDFVAYHARFRQEFTDVRAIRVVCRGFPIRVSEQAVRAELEERCNGGRARGLRGLVQRGLRIMVLPMLGLTQLSNYLVYNFEGLVLGCIEATFCK